MDFKVGKCPRCGQLTALVNLKKIMRGSETKGAPRDSTPTERFASVRIMARGMGCKMIIYRDPELTEDKCLHCKVLLVDLPDEKNKQ